MYSLSVAFGHIRAAAREQGLTFWGFLRRGRDPTTTAVFAEDAGAVAGLLIAGRICWQLIGDEGKRIFSLFIERMRGSCLSQILRLGCRPHHHAATATTLPHTNNNRQARPPTFRG